MIGDQPKQRTFVDEAATQVALDEGLTGWAEAMPVPPWRDAEDA